MRQQKTTETRQQYLIAARKYAARKLAELVDGEYRHYHLSHAVAKSLEMTEQRFVDIGTFGVEGFSLDDSPHGDSCNYLNAGDTYETTILHDGRRFMVGCYGDIVEKMATADNE